MISQYEDWWVPGQEDNDIIKGYRQQILKHIPICLSWKYYRKNTAKEHARGYRLGASLAMEDMKDLLEGYIFDFERWMTNIRQPFKGLGEEFLVNGAAKVGNEIEIQGSNKKHGIVMAYRPRKRQTVREVCLDTERHPVSSQRPQRANFCRCVGMNDRSSLFVAFVTLDSLTKAF